jgi:hypothetical protein
MTRRGIAIGSVVAILVAIGGWFGVRQWHHAAPAPQAAAPGSDALSSPSDNSSGLTTVGAQSDADPNYGATPMAQRVAVIGFLNKRNGETRDVTLKPCQSARICDAVIHLRACERTAPWEPQILTGAFVQLDVRGTDQAWRRVFSGWLFKERPALNVIQHPLYDVWPKSCAMTFPDGGPDSVAAAASVPAGAISHHASSAANEADAAPQAPADTPDSASPSNTM